jgi:hypothetical protein
MKALIRLEEFTLVILSLYLFLELDFSWWWFPLLFFVPDASLVGATKKHHPTKYFQETDVGYLQGEICRYVNHKKASRPL